MSKLKLSPSKRRRKERLTDRQREFATPHVGLLCKIALRARDYNLDKEDRVQEGYFALARAAKTFRKNRGFRFSTLATACIKRQIYRSERNGALVRVPVYLQGQAAEGHHLMANARAAWKPTSFAALPRESRFIPRTRDTLSVVCQEERSQAVKQALSELKPRERDIVLNLTTDEARIGAMCRKWRLESNTVRRIQYQAEEKLRERLAIHA